MLEVINLQQLEKKSGILFLVIRGSWSQESQEADAAQGIKRTKGTVPDFNFTKLAHLVMVMITTAI